MPPRDLWDINAIYQQGFFQSYCEFLASNGQLEVYPTYLMTDPEAEIMADGSDEDEEDPFALSEGWEHESIPDSDTEDVDREIGASALMMLYDDICNAIGDPRLGSRHLPIDLTGDDDGNDTDWSDSEYEGDPFYLPDNHSHFRHPRS